MTVHTVHVNTPSKSYDVLIGGGVLKQCGELISPFAKHAVIVTDDNVAPLYSEIVSRSLSSAGIVSSTFVLPHGEQSKNISNYTKLLESLCEANLTRADAVIALGGGVVGDLAGFAAATYLRGIRFVQMPTTLLAMVDSSVGGKTAVNLTSGKNQVGAFYQPDIVICDTATLCTLPTDIYADGCAEIIKHAVIRDAELFALLQKPSDENSLPDIIARNVEIKRDVVAVDERDTGLRQILNFGHTLGHSIEKLSAYTVPHGSAVAIGMVLETRDKAQREQIADLLQRYGLPTTTDFSPDELIEAAFADKKRLGGKITVVELEQIGAARLVTINMEDLHDYYGFAK